MYLETQVQRVFDQYSLFHLRRTFFHRWSLAGKRFFLLDFRELDFFTSELDLKKVPLWPKKVQLQRQKVQHRYLGRCFRDQKVKSGFWPITVLQRNPKKLLDLGIFRWTWVLKSILGEVDFVFWRSTYSRFQDLHWLSLHRSLSGSGSAFLGHCRGPVEKEAVQRSSETDSTQ